MGVKYVVLYRGDQYAIPFVVRLKREIVTPEMVDDVRIQIGTSLKEMSEQTLVWNSDKQTWDFYVTEEFTRSLTSNVVQYQVGVKVGNEIRYSRAAQLVIGDNIIKAVWSDA